VDYDPGMTAALTSLHLYPVKSCHRIDLDTAMVEPWGLAGDRRWVVVDEDGRQRTQRTAQRMALIRPMYDGDGRLLLRAPGMPDLALVPPSRTAGAEAIVVTVWRYTGAAAWAGAEADAWFTAFLGSPSRLGYMDDTSVRPTNPAYSLPEDRVSFADGYPLLLTSTSSLAALNSWIAEMGAEPVPMTRFRPNVVIAGAAPWTEESWKRVRIGGQVFRVVKPCDRCEITTVDPELGQFTGQQPLRALRRFHRSGNDVLFGMNLVPDTVGTLSVGDALDVLD